MSTGSVHHRAKHRKRAHWLVLAVAMVLGLTLARHWLQAAEPSRSKTKVQPRIVDFASRTKQKNEARQLLDSARKAATRGDLETARLHAEQAAAIPVDWNLGEASPKKFLQELDATPQQVLVPKMSNANRDVIELAFPEDRPEIAEDPVEDLTLTDVPTPSTRSEPPKTLRTLGFKGSEPAPATPSSEEMAPRQKSRFAPIPSLEELAAPTPEPKAPAAEPEPTVIEKFRLLSSDTTNRSKFHVTEEPSVSSAAPVKPDTSPSTVNDNITIPRGRMADNDTETDTASVTVTDAVKPSFGSRSRPVPREGINREMFASNSLSSKASESAASALPFKMAEPEASVRAINSAQPVASALPLTASPTTVIHEIRVAERVVSADSATNLNSTSASPLLANLNSLLMAGLFGALMLLVVEALVLLRKFRPTSQFTLKVDVNHPLAAAALEPTVKVASRPVPTTRLFDQKRQLEADLEHQQEDSMMRQVFEDNLKLREQLDETSIAA